MLENPSRELKILIEENNHLPEFNVSKLNDTQLMEHLSNNLYSKYNMKSSWLEIYSVGMTVVDESVRIYYSTFVPKDFLNEKTYSKFTSAYSFLPIYDLEQIQLSLTICAF